MADRTVFDEIAAERRRRPPMPTDLTRMDIQILRIHGPQSPIMQLALDAAEAHLDEPARLASARQEGHRDGVAAALSDPTIAESETLRNRVDENREDDRWLSSRDYQFGLKLFLRDRRQETSRALSPPPAEPSAPVTPDERRALNAEAQDYMIACGQHAEARRVAEARIAALEAENAKLREGLKDTTAHLVAAHSLLSRTPRAKKAAPSNTMFDMMLRDYEASCERARALLQGGPDAG